MLDRVTPRPDEWPPNCTRELQKRQKLALILKADAKRLLAFKEFYKTHPIEFIEDWGFTVDPRNTDADALVVLPFILFKRQKELIQFLLDCLRDQESGLVEKSRDMGATWLCCAFSVWLWLFRPGVSIGWSSLLLEQVDVMDDVKSIFEKMRIFIKNLPPEFWPNGFRPQEHLRHKRLVNPETNAVISGEGGDHIGRGGRSYIYFKDESAHYEHPERIEAALTSNTNVQIDISSVHGLGTVFHNKREAGVDWSPGAIIPKGKTRVFIMDWRHHPAKTQEWYDTIKQSYAERGLQHVCAQEIDRNYSASVIGVIIPPEWIDSAIDAHLYIPGFNDDGAPCAALDIADEGGDTNALATRKGRVLRTMEEWGERDTGVTARRAISSVKDLGSHQRPIDLQYDFGGGWGAAFKAEHNRLVEEGIMPKTVRPVSWNAGGEVINPDKNIIPGDKHSPLNKDYYQNFKSQGWWEVRCTFERTHRARTEPGYTYDTDDLISIDSRIPLLFKLKKELSQPTMGRSSKLKLLVNKKPDGAKSPNLADAFVMCYWPVPVKGIMTIPDSVLRRI